MFWGLSHKFKRWQKAELVTAAQVEAIIAFERKHKQGKLVRDLTNVGVFAILMGLVSVVAANWGAIPAAVKLAGHFMLNAGVAAFMIRVDGDKHPVLKDACVTGLFGLFLTLIALTGQVFQLHGDLHTTLLLWLGICTPFMWVYGRTYMVAGSWLTVALIALYWNIGHFFDGTPNRLLLIGSLISFYLPPVLLLFAGSGWLERVRPGFVWTFRKLGLYLPVIFANIAIVLFYDSTRVVEHQPVQMVLMAAALLGTFFLFRPATGTGRRHGAELRYYLMVSGIIMMLPFAFPEVESGWLSAGLFIGYWMFMAWLGAAVQSDSLSDWAIRLVILRLFIVYLEVFGSLLLTGFGLIISGVILLVVLRNLNRIVAVGRRLVNYEIG
jgi:hypothetical protein